MLVWHLDRRIEGTIHQHLIDVDGLLPDPLTAHPAPFDQITDALRHARGHGAGAAGNFVLAYAAPAVLVGIAAQGRQDTDVQRLQALVIEGGSWNGCKTAHAASRSASGNMPVRRNACSATRSGTA